MNRALFSLLLLFLPFCGIVSQPKYEVRAAWITTAYGLDWPRTKATTPEKIKQQQTELLKILDKLKAANFNTVLFQTRSRGDVFYRSKIEPMCEVLTGKINGDPGYDPLEFVINECHKRGMECQAWIVSLPLGSHKHVSQLGKYSALHHTHGICISYKSEYFLNPSSPGTKEYIMDIVREIMDHYDVDGFVFDYLRYPEYAGANFHDAQEFRRYGNGRSLTEWRRDNITDIVRYIYKGVKAVKPWIKVGTCPVGKYRDTSRYSSHGWNAFYAVNQDPEQWMKEGIQDQIYPMMYFRGENFYPFALDWLEQSNGRQVIPGLGTYFLSPSEGNWKSEDIIRQINFIRENKLAGESHFRMEYLMNNIKGIYDELSDHLYISPALQPPMTWLDSIAPTTPSNLQIKRDDYVYLSWKAARDNDTHNTSIYYVVYASDTYPVDTNRPENIIAQRIQGNSFIYAPIRPWDAKNYFAVTAIDRYGNEGKAVQEKR
jgi:uncharacterized lipoprotein YddW (UPF0748 family)